MSRYKVSISKLTSRTVEVKIQDKLKCQHHSQDPGQEVPHIKTKIQTRRNTTNTKVKI
jgi:hypothetical protein